MRPQHCCCGNFNSECKFDDHLRGFNEAAALLLRKFGLEMVAGLQCNRFNEAAALLLRKSTPMMAVSTVTTASMRPQHCCCGNCD